MVRRTVHEMTLARNSSSDRRTKTGRASDKPLVTVKKYPVRRTVHEMTQPATSSGQCDAPKTEVAVLFSPRHKQGLVTVKFHPVRRTVHEMTLVRNLIWTVRRTKTGSCSLTSAKDSSRNKFHPVRRTVHEMTLARNLIWTVRRTKTGSCSLTSAKDSSKNNFRTFREGCHALRRILRSCAAPRKPVLPAGIDPEHLLPAGP